MFFGERRDSICNASRKAPMKGTRNVAHHITARSCFDYRSEKRAKIKLVLRERTRV